MLLMTSPEKRSFILQCLVHLWPVVSQQCGTVQWYVLAERAAAMCKVSSIKTKKVALIKNNDLCGLYLYQPSMLLIS